MIMYKPDVLLSPKQQRQSSESVENIEQISFYTQLSELPC